MGSRLPRDAAAVSMNPRIASPVHRTHLSLGQWTANTTVTPAPRFIADRRLVIREVWFAVSAIPSDTDGTMLINLLNNDISEGADDTLISSLDGETVFVAANKSYQATLASETTENERTLEAGDTLRFTLVSNSAAIDTNASVSVLIIWQPLVTL